LLTPLVSSAEGGVGTNWRFSTNKPPYLRNGARYNKGYYRSLIGNRIRAFDWYQNEWPRLTLKWPWTAIMHSVLWTENKFSSNLAPNNWRQQHREFCSPHDVERPSGKKNVSETRFVFVMHQSHDTRRQQRQSRDYRSTILQQWHQNKLSCGPRTCAGYGTNNYMLLYINYYMLALADVTYCTIM